VFGWFLKNRNNNNCSNLNYVAWHGSQYALGTDGTLKDAEDIDFSEPGTQATALANSSHSMRQCQCVSVNPGAGVNTLLPRQPSLKTMHRCTVSNVYLKFS